MTLGIPENVWDIAIQPGDEVGVFNSHGDLVGAGVYDNSHTAICLWGNNEITSGTAGLSEKESFTLQLWSANSGSTQALVVTEWTEGDGTYSTNDVAIVGKLAVVTDKVLSLNNYPNPFSEATTLAFNIPEDGNVRIELYNAIGESLKVVTDRDYTAGNHELQLNVVELAVGSYFIKLESNGQTINKALQVVR